MLEVPDNPAKLRQRSKTKPSSSAKSDIQRNRLKEFGTIVITRSNDLVNDASIYQTYTFNAKIIQEWASRNQISPYLTTLFKGPDMHNRIINKVNSVQIIANSDVASATEGSGAATLTWTDKNGDISITTTGHVW